MPIVPKKLPNKGGNPAEVMEGRGIAKGNVDKFTASPTQSGTNGASKGLEGIRKIGKEDSRIQFTALLHHITPSLFVECFYALKRQAPAGVGEVTWREYEGMLYERVHDLHREIHTGAYKARPSRRVYIPKADGRLRPLGIAALEDKIVQQAVVTVLNEIYEADFLGFSYGFRVNRSQHNALDALAIGIERRKVNWILDADIRSFFDEIDHEWMMRFLEHRISDKRILRLIRNWLKAGVIEGGKWVAVIPRFLAAPLICDPAMSIQDVFRQLAANIERSQRIVEDVLQAYRAGRSILVLTERTEHLDKLELAFSDQIENMFALHGRMPRKQRTVLLEALEALPSDAPRVLLATGRLIGEGFDHPPLDMLMLAMPISWKGTLQQYAGRLHREHASKSDVLIYDYVDTGTPVLERMWEKRQRGYRAMGYQINSEQMSLS